MENIHNNLSEKQAWYRSWHTMDSHQIVHWLTFVLVLVLAWFTVNQKITDLSIETNDLEITVNNPQNLKASLILSPNTKEVVVGETFAVNIVLDARSGPIDGVDIYGLHYDPSILQVVDDLPNKSGIQILPGTIIPNTAINTVDATSGTIKLGQLSEGGESFLGKGILATIHFKAISAGSSFLKFDFSRGSTVDTNAAFGGKDKLNKVVDAIYTVRAK